jgi:hypothetical protein
MLAPVNRRPYILALIVSLSVGVLLLLHHHSDYITFPSARERLGLNRHGSSLPQLDKLCSAADPFDVEYGRTNIRLTRAYEGGLKKTGWE